MTSNTRNVLRALLVACVAGAAPDGSAAEARGDVLAYVMEDAAGLLQRFAPLFIIEHGEETYNRIGTPAARLTSQGKQDIWVDPTRATVYTQVERFSTEHDSYTNLIYRVHFEKNPFTLVPLNVSAGENVGFITVITLDSQENPVWLTTVQSCGCYHAIIPTDYLPQSAYPDTWNTEEVEVYGERLPGLLRLKGQDRDVRIAITIRGGSHRCKGVAVAPLADSGTGIPKVEAVTAPIEQLKHLPLPNGSETSFYPEKGRRKGLVKGAYKPLETFLFGLWAWDHNVGQDREYGPKEKVGRRFYTTLFFARKKDADMWRYARYLEHNGWKP